MKNKLSFFFPAFILFLQTAVTSPAQNSDFPVAWKGKWQGTLHLFPLNPKQPSVEMELHLLPTDSPNVWNYTLIYNTAENPDVRNYLLRKQGNHWVLDEQNSILIHEGWFDHTLISCFEVMGSLICSKLTFHKKSIVYEIYGGSSKAVLSSGGEGEVPVVTSYPIGFYHRAELKRKKTNELRVIKE